MQCHLQNTEDYMEVKALSIRQQCLLQHAKYTHYGEKPRDYHEIPIWTSDRFWKRAPLASRWTFQVNVQLSFFSTVRGTFTRFTSGKLWCDNQFTRRREVRSVLLRERASSPSTQRIICRGQSIILRKRSMFDDSSLKKR